MSGSWGSNNVRISKGVPDKTQFAGTDGTPIVIDVLTGIGYYFYDGLVRPLVGGVLIVTNAFSDGFSDGFANGS